MTKAIRIYDGRAVEIFATVKDGLAGKYHPSFIADLIDGPDDVQIGWYYVDGEWRALPPPEPIIPLDIKNECRQRIYAVANETSQMNMASFAAAGLFNEQQMAAYTSGLQWVAAMRAQCAALIAAADPAFADDSSWPACPPAAAALAAQF